jgi:hypothetical protein
MGGRGVSQAVARLLVHQSYRDRHGVTRQTRTWYLPVSLDGRRVLKPLGTTDLADACRKAAEILSGGDTGGPRLFEMLGGVEKDYERNHRRSLPNLKARCAHVREFFGNPTASDLTTKRFREYQVWRQKQGAENATINVELAAVARGFTLAKEDNAALQVPVFPWLIVRNARKGFFERPEAEAIIAHLPEHLTAFTWVAYFTGWRPKTELLTREWKHVNFTAGWMRLEPHETKNDEGREFKLYPDLRAVLEAQRARCDALERLRGAVVRWVFFTPLGKRVTHYAKEWEAARQKAGLPNRLVADFRRTAVRNLEWAGVPRSAAMKMTGHITEAVYRRYAIVDRRLLEYGADLLQKLHEGQRGQEPKVSPIDAKERY